MIISEDTNGFLFLEVFLEFTRLHVDVLGLVAKFRVAAFVFHKKYFEVLEFTRVLCKCPADVKTISLVQSTYDDR